MNVPAWASPYIGLAFDWDDAPPGVSCWGLVRRVLGEQCGVEVPAYGDTDARDLAAVAAIMGGERSADPWREVTAEAARPCDVVLMRPHLSARTRDLRREACHAGILIAPGTLLHIEEKTHSVAVPMGHWSVRRRIAGFFRHEGLA